MTPVWRLIEWRLRRRLPPEEVAPVLGDLIEDHRRRHSAIGPVRATVWLIREAGSVARSYPRRRALSGRRRLMHTLGSIATDLRLGLRMAIRQPTVSVAVVLTLALAIAANAALFSVVDGLLFRPLPLAHAHEIVTIDFKAAPPGVNPPQALRARNARRQELREALAVSPLFVDVVHGAPSDAFFGALDAVAELDVLASGVSAGFFEAAGVVPMLGREFNADDEAGVASSGPGAATPTPLPIIIGHAFWQRHFGGDRGVLDRVVELAGRSVRVIGVMGPGVRFPDETDVWTPPTRTLTTQLYDYGRLAPGVTPAALETAFPELAFVPLRDAVRPGGTETLVFLLASAVVLLLVAWVQVAALVFARAISGAPDLGVRLALGAGRFRLMRQCVAESVLLAAGALASAWVLVPWLTAFVIGRLPVEMTRGQYLAPDVRTLLFACGASAVGLIVMGALPVAVVRRMMPADLLRGSRDPGRPGVAKLRHAMLVVQIALTTLLVYVSSLATHSFVRALNYDYGFDADNVMIFSTPSDGDRQDRQRRAAESLEALRALPEVQAAATLMAPPLMRAAYYATLTHLDGAPVDPIRVRMNYVSEDFVPALGARVIAGSASAPGTPGAQAGVALVNESLARKLVGDPENVVGRQVQALVFRGPIVGVIADLVDTQPGEPSDPQIFMQAPGVAFVIAIRTRTTLEAATPAITTTLQRIWDEVPARRLRPMVDDLRTTLTPWRGRSVLFGLIAGFCLPLAAIGLAGAMLYTVRSRTRETAIRLALGADPRRIRRRVVVGAVSLAGTGLAIGLAGGIVAGHLMSSQLFDVRAVDGWALGATSVGLLGLAWLAALAPARRASRTDPSLALREG